MIKKYRYAKSSWLVMLTIVLCISTIAGMLCFATYSNAGGKYVEAASYSSDYDSVSKYLSHYSHTAYGYVYIYADNTWGRPSISSVYSTPSSGSGSSSTSTLYVYWRKGAFSYNLSGYSWSSSAPSSFSIKCRYNGDTSNNSSSDWSSLQSGSYRTSYTFYRSGSNFTYNSTSGSDFTFNVGATSSSNYYYWYVFYLELQSSYFTANTYTLYYDANGGTVSTTQISVTYRSTNVSPPTPSRTNYSFIGWYISGSRYTGGTWTYTSSKTAKAKWGCTVTFNSMGGSDCANMTVNTDEQYKSLPEPTRTGYVFVGWYKTSNFSGDMVAVTDVVQENHTLYAKWNCTVTFDPVGGTECAPVTVQVDSVYGTLPSTTRAGYTFDGWYRSNTYTGTQVAPTDIISVGHTLYAKWLSTINLDQKGGSGGSGSVKGTYNLPMPDAVAPVRMGYSFGGYYSGADGTGTRYYSDNMASEHLLDLPSGTTLYAKWTVAKYILYYNASGGSLDRTEQEVEFGSNVTLQTPTRTGYTFLGWYLDGSKYSGGTWTYIENKTVTAKWGYTLTYNANGGLVSIGNIIVVDGDVITLPTPTRDGCTFAGWFVNNNAYFGGLWMFTSNQTAVAKWNCTLDVSVANNQQGYYTGTDIGSYEVGSAFNITAVPLPGYIFDSWVVNSKRYTAATYSGTFTRNTIAVAYFTKAQPTANVYATNGSIASTYLNIEPDTYSATLRISPEAGKYVTSISFDNVAYYTIDSWSTTLYASSNFAQNVAYRANEGNNDLWLTFNYYNSNKTVNVYVNLTTTPYSNLNVPKNTGGALDGIAVSANYGGSVTLVGADYETLADSDEIICTAKLAHSGYEFVGWVFVDSPSTILSTDESTKFTKSKIYGRQLMAKFQPTADNADYNMDINNV